jgi:signal transduction histidine kinase/anti-sigma regulatory factor (Ser/Thr protein kinase)
LVSTEHFTVDAALLEELGERLIGRPDIALAELVKNAYDADAATCQVTFGDDQIEVSDNGHGMDLDEFKGFWLRIGTRHKAEEEQSRELGRRLTGSKGVGRLAVQFLARELELVTTPKKRRAATTHATVDWTKIRRGEDLHSFKVEVDQDAPRPVYPNGKPHGTKLILKGLRSDWGPDELKELGRLLWLLRSPFRAMRRQGPTPGSPEDFEVELEAPSIPEARENFDAAQQAITESVWKARITGRVSDGRRSDHARVEIEFRSNYPSGSAERSYSDDVRLSELRPLRTRSGDDDEDHVTPEDGVDAGKPLLDEIEFTIFVYRLERQQADRVPLADLKEFLRLFGNVSVYDAGFRLPYYGVGHDWLRLEEVHSSRLSSSDLLPSKWNIGERYMLDIPTTRRLFGAVELDTAHEERAARQAGAKANEWLQIQPGRDRLHLNAAHDQLTELLRYSLDLYANRYRARAAAAVDIGRVQEPATKKQERVVNAIERHRDVIPAPVYRELRREAVDAQAALKNIEREIDTRSALLAPLAAAGMTALAMTHELARETRSIDRARRTLTRLAKQHDLPELKETADELGASLERLRALQGLFSPLLSDEDRTGDTRLRVKGIVDQVVHAMRPLLPGLEIEVDVPEDLRFPSAPLSSWNAVLQNLLANSWNAVLDAKDRRVRIEGHRGGGEEWIWISDTGVGLGIPLEDSDVLFEPFERRLNLGTDNRSLAIGGQGMGLAIVRMICSRHKTTPQFVSPEDGYSTTLQLSWRR